MRLLAANTAMYPKSSLPGCVRVINPSNAFRVSVHPVDEGYERTCHSDTCSCASHDRGYDWIDIPSNEASILHIIPGTPSSHQRSLTKFEHDIIEKERAREAEAALLASMKAHREALHSRCLQLYGEHAVKIWKAKIRWAMEDQVAEAAKHLIARRSEWVKLVTPSQISHYRQSHFPDMSGPRFESALAVADIIHQ